MRHLMYVHIYAYLLILSQVGQEMTKTVNIHVTPTPYNN